ncbi:MAG: SdrD B-like domain-containing protein [Caldilineaceae bacterium]
MTDTCDTAYMSYNAVADATGPKPATEPTNDGSIYWANAIDFDPDNQLDPNETLELIVYFDAAAATTALADDASCLASTAGQTVNFASANGVAACVGVTIDPAPSKSTLGDFVWYDVNGDGVKDVGERGIDGVRVELYEIIDNAGVTSTQFITYQITGPDSGSIDSDDTPTYGNAGAYDFVVQDNKIYMVVITATNFLPGGPLADYVYTGDNAGNAYNGLEPRVVPIGTQVDYNDADFPFSILPALAVSKTLNGDNPFAVSDTISFTIRITNTGGVTLTVLPLEDRYSNVFIDFVSASVAPDSDQPGVLSWNDLTTALGDLCPGESVSLDVTFATLADSTLLTPMSPCMRSGHAPNIAQIDGAFADPDGEDGAGDDVAVVMDADDKDCAEVQILNPTGLQLAARSVTQTPAGVLVRWQMADATNVVGFNLWRSNGVNAERRNGELILTSTAGQNRGGLYEWLDEGALLRRGDAYVLEIVRVDGSTERIIIGVKVNSEFYMPIAPR